MSNAAKAHEPTMEEILASIRRIIADDEPAAQAAEPKPAAPVAEKPAPVAVVAEEPSGELGQDDIDAMLASFDAAEPEPAEPAAKKDDVLELTKPVAKAPAAPVSADLDFVEPKAAPPAEDPWDSLADDDEEEGDSAPAAQALARSADAVAQNVGEGLLAPEASAAVASAFSSLAHTILNQNARTLDDLVEEMLRPMLKNWLDDNLPGIVERLVRAEIERVSRGPKR